MVKLRNPFLMMGEMPKSPSSVIRSPIPKRIWSCTLTSKSENRQAREYGGATVFQIQGNISNRIILDFWRPYVEGNNSLRMHLYEQDVTIWGLVTEKVAGPSAFMINFGRR